MEELSRGQKSHFTRLINEFKKEAEKALSDIRKVEVAILIGNEEKPAMINKLQDLEIQIDEICTTINNFHNSIFEVKEGEDEPLSTKIESFVEDYSNSKHEIDEVIEQINEYKAELFGIETEGESESPVEGLKDKVEKYIEKLELLHSTNTEKQKKLFDEIEGLLKGASTVALAKAFDDHKNSFNGSNITWIIAFVLSLLLMMGLSVWGFINANYEFKEMWKYTIGNLPFLGGSVWLAIYASKQRSQNRRLQQEYAYKEDVAKIYYGLKKEIEELGETDLGKKLNGQILEVIIKTVSFNPSETLDNKSHEDKGPIMDALHKVGETVKNIKN